MLRTEQKVEVVIPRPLIERLDEEQRRLRLETRSDTIRTCIEDYFNVLGAIRHDKKQLRELQGYRDKITELTHAGEIRRCEDKIAELENKIAVQNTWLHDQTQMCITNQREYEEKIAELERTTKDNVTDLERKVALQGNTIEMKNALLDAMQSTITAQKVLINLLKYGNTGDA